MAFPLFDSVWPQLLADMHQRGFGVFWVPLSLLAILCVRCLSPHILMTRQWVITVTTSQNALERTRNSFFPDCRIWCPAMVPRKVSERDSPTTGTGIIPLLLFAQFSNFLYDFGITPVLFRSNTIYLCIKAQNTNGFYSHVNFFFSDTAQPGLWSKQHLNHNGNLNESQTLNLRVCKNSK